MSKIELCLIVKEMDNQINGHFQMHSDQENDQSIILFFGLG
jgi:hypothetical protein